MSKGDNHLGLDATLPLPIFLAVDFPLLHVPLSVDRGLRHFPYNLSLSRLQEKFILSTLKIYSQGYDVFYI